MLQEIAITPDVFHKENYSTVEECDLRLESISQRLLDCFLVRNLRDGNWFTELNTKKNHSPRSGQKLLKQLRIDKRLPSFQRMLLEKPESPEDWCKEALAANTKKDLAGILTTKEIKKAFESERLVSSINKYRNSDWWKKAVDGVPPQIFRNTASYLEHFGLTLRNASHVVIMDPQLDPTKNRSNPYREFDQLLIECGPTQLIEIHRPFYSGLNREAVSNTEWEHRFNKVLAPIAKQYNQAIKVVLWPHKHDRYLITNLMSYQLGNGLKVKPENDPDDELTCATWTRKQANKVLRKLDAGSPIHWFKIG